MAQKLQIGNSYQDRKLTSEPEFERALLCGRLCLRLFYVAETMYSLAITDAKTRFHDCAACLCHCRSRRFLTTGHEFKKGRGNSQKRGMEK